MRVLEHLFKFYNTKFLHIPFLYIPFFHIFIFLITVVCIFSLKFFIKIYRILHIGSFTVEKVTQKKEYIEQDRKCKHKYERKYKKTMQRLIQLEKQIEDLEKRVNAIEKLCEETPEEEEKRLSTLNSSNICDTSRNTSCGSGVCNNSHNNSNNNVSCDTSFRNSGYLKNSITSTTMGINGNINNKKKNLESINHSNMSIDMSESLMLDV